METILAVIIIILIFIFLNRFLRSRETFDRDTVMYVPQTHRRYGLRGDVLCPGDPLKQYYGSHRQIVLDHTGGNLMYISDRTPAEEGNKGYSKVPCPKNTFDGVVAEYDKMDTCWAKKGSKCKCQYPLLDDPDSCLPKIPDLWPH